MTPTYLQLVPITTMGCRQYLPLSVVQVKSKHCRKPHCRNGVADMFGHRLVLGLEVSIDAKSIDVAQLIWS